MKVPSASAVVTWQTFQKWKQQTGDCHVAAPGRTYKRGGEGGTGLALTCRGQSYSLFERRTTQASMAEMKTRSSGSVPALWREKKKLISEIRNRCAAEKGRRAVEQ